jgi:alanine dehydrogenase
LSNIFAPILLNIGEEGGVENMLRRQSGVRHGVYLYNGHSTNKHISDTYNLTYKEIDLLLNTF